MIISNVTFNNEFINICEIEASKNYRLSFKIDHKDYLHIHLHTNDGNCLDVLPFYGSPLLQGRKYTYPITATIPGYIAVKSETEGVIMYDITLEEVEEDV